MPAREVHTPSHQEESDLPALPTCQCCEAVVFVDRDTKPISAILNSSSRIPSTAFPAVVRRSSPSRLSRVGRAKRFQMRVEFPSRTGRLIAGSNNSRFSQIYFFLFFPLSLLPPFPPCLPAAAVPPFEVKLDESKNSPHVFRAPEFLLCRAISYRASQASCP